VGNKKGNPHKLTALQKFETSLHKVVSPWVQNTYKVPGGLLYELEVGLDRFLLLTGLSTVHPNNVLEYFSRYVSVLETLFNIIPGEDWRVARKPHHRLVYLLIYQLVRQTNLMTITNLRLCITKESTIQTMRRKHKNCYKELKNKQYAETLEAVVSITRKYFYENFKIYDEDKHLRADCIRFPRGKAIPDGVYISFDRRELPTFSLSDGPPRNKREHKRRNRSHTKLPRFSL
jgi:hypothetical protein